MSIRNNFKYSLILTLSTYLVPLLVFPYISRVLGAERIGAIDTVDGIIDYLVLFSMMGMQALGIREIARHKDDKAELQSAFNDLFWLNAITMVVALVILCFATCFVPELQQRGRLLLIGSFKLVANLFWIEWFYRGLENFRYITIRSIIVRLLFVASVFIFVRDEGDFAIYYLLFVGIVVLNAFCNWTYRSRLVSLSLRHVNLRRYLKPFMMLGIFAILSAIYTKLTLPILSFLCGDEQAGYYSVAVRMYQVIIALISSLISVLIPRMSVLIKQERWDVVNHYYTKAIKLLVVLAALIIIIMEILAPYVIYIFAGKGFEPAILPMRLVMIQVLVVGLEQILVLQLLIPLREDKTIVKCGLCGSLTWLLLTFILIPRFQCVGAAIVWIASETMVLILAARKVNKKLKEVNKRRTL